MENALIGFSGFVGSSLLKQTEFEHLYRSINIADIENNTFDPPKMPKKNLVKPC